MEMEFSALVKTKHMKRLGAFWNNHWLVTVQGKGCSKFGVKGPPEHNI